MNKRLTRPRYNRMIGGVCAGIGEYLDLDPTVVRIIYVLLSIGTVGTAVVVYFILCLIIPES
ncbi:PspC domain-containing protein [Barnesiella sp. An55]|uniref:PspC domain-containing protein n=1 Tax=Barnesiella sp. An55 TaxID=1965646 RepID=UPI000B36AC5C|nr:PspC domain-containing protein [Barnesiella sp. An55]OUN72864.1 PspC family transcriptional regulator [Barnesiella sp. An55]HIZ27355.1 PspC domain-containing protein [Candidatus Barnesiella merdipullorum]